MVGACLLCNGGCNPGEPYPVAVQGTVTLDGQPVNDGKISFVTLGQVPETLDVQAGKFNGKARWGQRRVEIAAYRPYQIPADVPAHLHELMKDGKENYLPEKYHRQSTLTANVQQAGLNEFHFDLASQ